LFLGKNIQVFPVALAHSSGSIATMAALREGSLPYAVFVSPTFLNPREEIFCSPRFSRKVMVHMRESGIIETTMEPKEMYPMTIPNDHLDDPLYWDNIVSPQAIDEVAILVGTRARIFIGSKDWNYRLPQYPQLVQTDVIEDETHAFTAASSIIKITDAILDLAIQ
jgi:hypothetical protein